MEQKKMPLEGIRVVELATVVARPDRVARAVRVRCGSHQSRNQDRRPRCAAPVSSRWSCARTIKTRCSTIQNSGQAATSIDLKNPDGKAAMRKLLETADVFLTNVRLPSLGRLGLDYETLHAAYPGLVYAHFSGFGPKGPDAAKPALTAQALAARGRWPTGGARSFPFTPTYAFGDMATSSAFLSGILMRSSAARVPAWARL